MFFLLEAITHYGSPASQRLLRKKCIFSHAVNFDYDERNALAWDYLNTISSIFPEIIVVCYVV